MNLTHPGAVLLGCALVVTGCASTDEPAGTSGGSKLEPTFHPEKRRKHEPAKKSPTGRAGPTNGAPAPETQSAPGGGRGASPSPAPEGTGGPASSSSAPPASRTSDRSGDVTGGLGAVPAYVDVSGAEVASKAAGFAVEVVVASSLPRRMTGNNTMNMVAFFDTDGDGSIDYEALAGLADTGWTTASRSPSGSRFGSDSGVRVTVSGKTLTLGFARSFLGGAGEFRWAVGSEYGTYEQVAAGTTAHDYAPDTGAVAFGR